MTKLLALALVVGFAASARAAPDWRYEVAVGPKARVLAIEAVIAPGASDELGIAPGAEPYVRGLEVGDGVRWIPARATGDRWMAPRCSESGCRIRYHFLLGDAADLKGPPLARRIGAVIVAPPSTWMLRPLHAGPAVQVRFHFDVPAGVRALSGVDRVEGLDEVYQAPVTELAAAPPAAFGSLAVTSLEIAGGRIDVAIAPGRRALSDAQLVETVKRAGSTVAAWLGRAPRDRLLVLMLADAGDKLTAVTRAGGGAEIVARVGAALSPSALAASDALEREMVRLTLPTLDTDYTRLADGLVTYATPLARARAGQIPPEAAWESLLGTLPDGARFWLVADLRIRAHTHNRRSLDDALRAIADEGGDIAARWTLEHLLTTCDRAVGSPIVTTLYGELDEAGLATELSSSWRRLGVIVDDDGKITFDDAAPLAAIRRSLTAR
ncbi:MAG TPA: hypothetical protein VII38_19670 [Polyangia bacterium]